MIKFDPNIFVYDSLYKKRIYPLNSLDMHNFIHTFGENYTPV
jgi:hypothetical protein